VGEAEWEACADPREMLRFLRGRAAGWRRWLRPPWAPLVQATPRRLVLLACACRRLWAPASLESLRAIRSAEARADGAAGGRGTPALVGPGGEADPWEAAFAALAPFGPGHPLAAAAAGLVRCAFGSPFRPVALDPLCLSADVLLSAGAVSAERAFDRLPALADLLEEEGADDPLLLSHLRGPGPHAPGCFALDAVLGLG
jgi:hypothetical protein